MFLIASLVRADDVEAARREAEALAKSGFEPNGALSKLPYREREVVDRLRHDLEEAGL